jgi:DNA recombination protein RmuC
MPDSLWLALVFLAGLLIGGASVWLGVAMGKAGAARGSEETFKALAADAMRSNNQDFLLLARQQMDTVLAETRGNLERLMAEARGDLGNREKAIEGLVQPLQTSLEKYEKQVRDLEESRQREAGSLSQQIRALSEAQQRLQKETGNLVSALRQPQVRGRWGELTLRRVVELAGMVDHCDFQEQVSTDIGDGRVRPDLVVRLPNGRQVVVDSKAPLEAYLRAVEAGSDDDRKLALTQHARQVRTHMGQLSSKAYWSSVGESPEFVVMFMPGEPFLAAAVQHDADLIEEGLVRNVVIATPSTLVALLKAVAYGWQQERLAENAKRIGNEAQVLYKRTSVLVESITAIGSGLDRATKSYNAAVGSLEARWMPQARRVNELLGGGERDLPELQPVTQTPRAVSAPEANGAAGPIVDGRSAN